MILSRCYSSQFRPEEECAHMWPYRTTPLVLPGAKVQREPLPTESYLRHHPNPAVRRPPHMLDNDQLYKQKVVHKQFNSPIGLHSEANIIDTVHKQIGASPARKSVKFNPAESETYKALQEEQLGEYVHEVAAPPQSKVYAPNKAIPANKSYHQKPAPAPAAPEPRYALNDNEVIHQSNSFKRLMWSVMSESSY